MSATKKDKIVVVPEKLEKTGLISIERDGKGKFVSGHVGVGGRPKGKTIKEMVRDYLEANPDAMDKFVEHFVKNNRELAWQMLEGRPQQDVTSKGEKLPTPIYGGLSVPKDDGDAEAVRHEEEN